MPETAEERAERLYEVRMAAMLGMYPHSGKGWRKSNNDLFLKGRLVCEEHGELSCVRCKDLAP